MNQIFSTQDGLCVGFTDDDFADKMLIFKYNKVLGKFTLAPEQTCKVIADYLDSVNAYDKAAHPEHIKKD